MSIWQNIFVSLCILVLAACGDASPSVNDLAKNDPLLNKPETNHFFTLETLDTKPQFISTAVPSQDPTSYSVLSKGENNDNSALIYNSITIKSDGKIDIKQIPCSKLCDEVTGVLAYSPQKKLFGFSVLEVFDENGNIIYQTGNAIEPVINPQNQVIGFLDESSDLNKEKEVFFRDLNGKAIKSLSFCNNDKPIISSQVGSFWKKNNLFFFLLDFDNQLLCMEDMNGNKQTYPWPHSRIRAANVFGENFLTITDDYYTNTETYDLIDIHSGMAKELFRYSKPDIKYLGSSIAEINSKTEFIGCDKQSYFAISQNGVSDYPFSRVLIFNQAGQIVFDMKSNRIRSVHPLKHLHSLLLIGNDGIRMLKDKRC